MRKIEHLGIAVADLKKSNDLFEKLLGKGPYKTESVAGENVETSFFQVGETKIELLQAEMNRLKEAGFEILNEIPKKGADHKIVVFLHPRSTNGVLVELCQDDSSKSV
jgi:methylmalonyl-CoA/ethylmalonyl-CoA epimerase